jgi:hypothetical protein
MLRKIDYSLVLTNLGATESEIASLLAEEEENIRARSVECYWCGEVIFGERAEVSHLEYRLIMHQEPCAVEALTKGWEIA